MKKEKAIESPVAPIRMSRIPLANINRAPYNPRVNLKVENPEKYRLLKASILEFSCVELLVWNEQTGNLVGGHQRLDVLEELGAAEVDVSVVNLSLSKEKALNVSLNQNTGDWDLPRLKDLLQEIDTGEFDMEITGFTEKAMAELMSQFHAEGEAGEVEAPEPPKIAVTQVGGVWLCGEHRVMCGDSTDAAAVAILMAGEKAILVATDPPYGVMVDHSHRNNNANRNASPRGGTIKNDDRADWGEVFLLFDAPILYVWHGAMRAIECAQGLVNAGYQIVQQIIWAKTTMTLCRSDYHWKHEPCWYAIKKGHNHNWQGDRSQVTVWESPSPIWGRSPDGAEVTEHPTQKPVKLFAIPILNNTKPGDICAEPFCGSGSCLIAAEQLNRRCYAMEIDPRWCDVSVLRWQTLTNQEPILEATGQPFSEVARSRGVEVG